MSSDVAAIVAVDRAQWADADAGPMMMTTTMIIGSQMFSAEFRSVKAAVRGGVRLEIDAFTTVCVCVCRCVVIMLHD